MSYRRIATVGVVASSGLQRAQMFRLGGETARTWALLLSAAAIVGIIAANMIRPGPGMEGMWPWAGGLMAFPISAAVVLLRARGNAIGRLLGFVAVAAGIDFALSWMAVSYAGTPQAAYAAAFTTPASVGIFIGILAVLHLFPTGRPISRWHRRVVVALGVWGVGFAILGLFVPGPAGFSRVANPMGVGSQWVGTLFEAGFFGVPLFALAGVVILFLRRRKAGPVERAQLKWFFAGAAVLTLVLIFATNSGESDNVVVETVAQTLVMFAFWSLPAAIVVAIVRYHLYDIDRLVSRTVTYVVVAGVLTAVYAGCVVALQSVLPAGGSQLAVAASTLAVAGLFAPLRTRVRSRLDRRFNRARYEAAAVTANYARNLQHQINIDAIESDLLGAVARTLQPGTAALWLRPDPMGAVRAQR
jgi:hypothetical protein